MTSTPRGIWLRHPLTLAAVLTFVFGSAAAAVDLQGAPRIMTIALYAAAYAAGGWHASLAGLQALRRLEIQVDLLMVLAAVGAAVLGYWQEGATLLFLFTLSNALQALALDRTRGAVEALMQLRPERALRVGAGGDTEWVPVADLRVGDLVLVRPGDRIPVDGEVHAGRSWVDEAAMTGEPMPVGKGPGDAVYAGTLNGEGTLEVRVLREASDTLLARIVRLVEQARAEKAAVQERIERFEQRYAQVVIAGTVLLAAVPILLGEPAVRAVYRALTIMVVASPCAVAIAAPAAFLAALSAAARSGVLLKGGRYLERLAEIDTVAMDKTGTLTLGQPAVAAAIPVPGRTPAGVLRLAAAVEAYSEHPLGAAIVREARRRGLEVPPAADVTAQAGRGIEGRVEGRLVRVGAPAMFVGGGGGGGANEAGGAAAWLEHWGRRLRHHGLTVVWVGAPEPVGLIALRDQLRPEAAATVAALRRAGVRRVVVVTGDSREAAQAIARRAGIDEVYAGLLPGEKVARIEALAREGRVAMVGDGINDAPALARAHVGIAMGGVGSDVALESADVVLVADQLDRIPYALELGRRTRRVVWQGLAAAVGVIVVLVALTLSGAIGLAAGVLGHEGSTVLVALNGLRLLFATHGGAPAPAGGTRAPGPAARRLDAA